MNGYDILMGVGGIGVVLAGMFLVYLVVLWAVLPFAIFGIKPLLEKVIDQQAEVVKGLKHLSRQNAAFRIESLRKIAVNTDPILLTDEVEKED